MVGLLSVALFLLADHVHGYGDYRHQIPNGERVPHPCRPNYYWHGLGHINALGGGDRNDFGTAFAAAGNTWTKTLCEADTDGDGKTNGEELGDPNCIWTPGETLPERTIDITHPGVCDPFTSEECQATNEWVSCKGLEMECDPMSEAGVMNFTLRFPETEVPAQDTTYMCMVFDVPADKDYHLIGIKPLIDNDNVMHHAIMYGCGPWQGGIPTKPYVCGMGAGYGCDTPMGGWTVGSPGGCLNSDFGMLFGKSRLKRFAVEFHWNNPKKIPDTTDSSGMTIYYTPNLRPNNGGIFATGQFALIIPPRQPSITFTQECSSECTRHILNRPMYVTSVLNHMHYLGKQEYIEHFRDGKRLRYLSNEPEFNYDKPKSFTYDPPVEFRPGDSLKTTCVFSSRYSDKYVFQGDATSDEMCFGFIYFYPREAANYSFCTANGDIDTCNGLIDVVKDDCDINSFLKRTDAKVARIFSEIDTKCNLPAQMCTDECETVVKEAFEHPCLRSKATRTHIMRTLQRNQKGKEFISKLAICAMNWDYSIISSSAASKFLAIPLLLGTALKLLI